jgi:Aspartyl/Asparaginyl beta-hydroxylase
MSSAQAAERLQKRSFLQLPVEIDVERLLEDYKSIPAESWASTHWDVHCSSNMILLRGGNQGTEEDFYSTDSIDHEVLKQLPYIGWLIGETGPFGGSDYAFILRMKPLGVSRPHIDSNPAWFEPFRVHVPITTNDGAFLLSEGRSKHLAVGEVWTFDNQAEHAVTNGDAVRAHLIFDVPPRPKLRELIEHAEFDAGDEDPANWRAAGLPDKIPTLAYALSEPLSLAEKADLGLAADSFASRVVALRPVARLTRADLQVGDIISRVNGVSECAVARTATDYIQVRHRPKEMLDLELIRGAQERNVRVRLFGTRQVDKVLRAGHAMASLKHRITAPAQAPEGAPR